jgi:hypothetical protein
MPIMVIEDAYNDYYYLFIIIFYKLRNSLLFLTYLISPLTPLNNNRHLLSQPLYKTP